MGVTVEVLWAVVRWQHLDVEEEEEEKDRCVAEQSWRCGCGCGSLTEGGVGHTWKDPDKGWLHG